MIDWNRVSELREEIGQEDFVEVIDLFVDEVDTEIAELRHSADVNALKGRLHFLRGSALNLGFSALAQMCQTTESFVEKRAANDTDIGAILACYHASKSEFLRVVHEVKVN